MPVQPDLTVALVASLSAVAAVAGVARGFSGFGAALIFMPLASALVGPKTAAPCLLIVDAVMALGLIPRAWRTADRGEVAVMAVGALVGVPLGTLALARLDALTVRWTIAAIVAGLLGLLASGRRYRGRPAAWSTVGVGAVAGFCSGVAQIGGPPVVAYWLGGPGAGGAVRANVVLYFAVSTALTLASYGAGHLLTPPVLMLCAALGPAYGLGLLAGARLFGRASEAAFRRICLGLIGAAALASLPILDRVLR